MPMKRIVAIVMLCCLLPLGALAAQPPKAKKMPAKRTAVAKPVKKAATPHKKAGNGAFIVISKKDLNLRVYSRDSVLLAQYPACLSKNKGDKQRELKTMLTTDNAYAQNTKLFHQNFDAAFLNIYPGFVEAVNALLRPDEQIVVDENERLSSDLRLLALMRLGITDNAQIASILRTNVTTIYSYRSRLRSRAIDKATFEDDVMHIDA